MTSNKNHLFKIVWLYAVIEILLFPSARSLGEISGAELLNLLSEKDRISNSTGYKISFVIATQHNPFNDPNQGRVFMDCEATWAKEAFAMKITNHYEHPPVFAAPGFGGYRAFDYDNKGNLIVWRSLGKYILSTSERNDTFEKLRVFFIDPDGQIVETGDNVKLHRFPIGSLDSCYEFRQFQLATGRGFSKYLNTITSTSVETLSSGLMKVTSQGSYGPSLQGTWELTLDPNSDYLVREAIFTMEGEHKPTTVITSSGAMKKDGISLAKYGTYKYSNLLELNVEVTNISKIDGPNKLYEEILSYINSPLPKGASIIDMRGEKPVRTTAK